MLIPSLDLEGGRVVQLVGGETQRYASDDISGWAERLAVFGEIAVVDQDAAKRGPEARENHAAVASLCRRYGCRIGGGVRTEARARELLKAGASRLMVGTAATVELLTTLPRDVWIACLDHRDGVVVDRGWRGTTGEGVLERAKRLAEHVGGFLVTNVDVEGRLAGPNAELAIQVREGTGLPVTAAGGVRSADDVAALHRAGVDAQVGMAIYLGELDPVDAFLACVRFDRGANGLVPTFVVDERGRTLMTAWSSPESLRIALTERRGCYFSRSRQSLWRKGESSGHAQRLVRAGLDCDGDALRLIVEQTGPACHTGEATCYGEQRFDIGALESHLRERLAGDGYTAKLAADPRLARRKVMEEAYELVDAHTAGERDRIISEAADLVFHTLTLLAMSDVSLCEVEAELGGRRRP